MKEVGNERRAEEEHAINEETGKDIEPEHRIIVAGCGILQIDKPLRETATLQIASDEREYGEHPHQAIFARREQTPQENAYEQIEHLHRAIVHRTPKQVFCRFIFK